jgi:hypothetical protein
VSAQATVERETRDRRWAVPTALAAAILPFAASIGGRAALGDSPENSPAAILALHDHATGVVAVAAVAGIGIVLTAGALLYLFDAVRARRPAVPPAFRWLAILGPVLSGVTYVVLQVQNTAAATEFATEGGQTYARVVDLFTNGIAKTAQPTQIVGLFGAFCLAASLTVLSINAMRVGLLPRVLGYIGIFAAVVTIIPLFPAPVVLWFWLGALAALISGRWPGGRPRAWETGEAEPWPAPGAAARAGGEAAPRGWGRAAPSDRSARNDPPPPPPSPPREPGAARRKRKKRG